MFYQVETTEQSAYATVGMCFKMIANHAIMHPRAPFYLQSVSSHYFIWKDLFIICVSASSDVGVVAGIAGGAGVVVIIALVIVVIVYLNVNKRLKVMNQTLKLTSATKSGTLTSKQESRANSIAQSSTTWEEGPYNISPSHKPPSRPLYETIVPPISSATETMEADNSISGLNVSQYEEPEGDQDI